MPVGPDDIMYLILPYKHDERNVLELAEYIKKLYKRRADTVLVTTTIMTDYCFNEEL